ncbi:MAG: response regulator [Epsilonproteobacteria bacterium]|nr:response regulator [Campylobacterota bacterium]
MHTRLNNQLTILVCEKELRLLKRLESWVKAMGNIAYTTDDGIEALTLFERERPDILLLSQDLKSMGGLELIEKIKANNPLQAVILMFSQFDDNHIVKKSIDLQVDKYLNKPVDATLLFNAVDALYNEKIFHEEFIAQKQLLQDYKDAIDKSFNVSVHDKEGRITHVNEAFCATLRLEYEDALKGVLNPLDNPRADMQALWRRLREENLYKERQTFLLSDEREYIIDVTAVGLKDKYGTTYEYLVFSDDVTEIVKSARKIKEQEIDKKLQKLEHIKEVNRIKDSFLTIFTHELKTPLNSIINFSEHVQKRIAKMDAQTQESLSEKVGIIHTSGLQMLDMITNLIDAMRLRDGKVKLQTTLVSLNNVVDMALAKHSQEVTSLKVITKYMAEVDIEADEKRMLQLVGNIVSNAIKYAHSKIAIVIRAESDGRFSLEIIDDGDGFADKTKLFTLFEQYDDDDMTRKAKGAGVGLYVVRQLCDRMGFTIEIADSKEFGGARVIIKGRGVLKR